MDKKYWLLGLLFLITTSLFSQVKSSVSNLFDKVEQYYGVEKDFCYSSHYKLFQNTSSNIVVDEYDGQTIKKGKTIYQKINATESISFEDYIVTVSKKDKTIAVVKATSKKSPMALKSLLKMCNKEKVIENKKYWICELSSDKQHQKQFQKISIYINKKDYSLYKEIFYTNGIQEIEKNKKKSVLKNPRFEIFYKNNILSYKDKSDLLRKEYYFSIKNKKIIPASRFKKYKLITL
ncbi:hypothetical protein EQG63_04740 [Flavobacterium amnicola]|uniref:Uncharacterized protein n=1 Tax=Flavobacterium amnicola TaxID=2506422 RepID=A0A4Q1K9G4_9FLAO|nr:hypothetical protein [Flavobacterium amnicola]RXR21249.1 hypothetical protein EQG63_04740 [Flavobacterium amnicola]